MSARPSAPRVRVSARPWVRASAGPRARVRGSAGPLSACPRVRTSARSGPHVHMFGPHPQVRGLHVRVFARPPRVRARVRACVRVSARLHVRVRSFASNFCSNVCLRFSELHTTNLAVLREVDVLHSFSIVRL